MKGWSKAVGAGLGYFMGGPIGAVLGYMAGHKLTPKLPAAEGHLLTANLLGFTALLLKANTTPSLEQRQETVRFIARLFRFDAEDEHTAGELLDRLLAVDLDILAMAKSFNHHCGKPMRERLLEILATVCLFTHGPLQGRQLGLLSRTAEALNLSQPQWQALKSRYQTLSPTLDIDCCYALLEIFPESSESEIRAAYRRLAKKYHPDLATHLEPCAKRRQVERMTLIKTAYETIRAHKGF
jgi:DnaJ like chaperone protein